jgi:uncharacterized protein (DUF1778 family)
MNTKEKTRFDTRLSKEQKDYFEYASKLGGFKTLSDFILTSAKSQADQIVDRHRQILASEQDRETFFHALVHPKKPNTHLKTAVGRYKKEMAKK